MDLFTNDGSLYILDNPVLTSSYLVTSYYLDTSPSHLFPVRPIARLQRNQHGALLLCRFNTTFVWPSKPTHLTKVPANISDETVLLSWARLAGIRIEGPYEDKEGIE